jgi:hypothetical protein
MECWSDGTGNKEQARGYREIFVLLRQFLSLLLLIIEPQLDTRWRLLFAAGFYGWG